MSITKIASTENIQHQSLALLVFAFCLHSTVYGGFFGMASYMDGFGNYSLWFPAAGFRFALIFILGWRWGLLIALAEITAQGIIGDWATWDHRPLWIFFGSGSPSFVHALVVFVLHRFRLTSVNLKTLSEVSWFVGALVITPLLAAPVAAGIKVLGGRVALDALPMSIMSYWIGDMVGMLMFAPLVILAWQAWQKQHLPDIKGLFTSGFMAEFTAALLFITLIVQYAGVGPLSLRWLPFVVPVLVMALRWGFGGAAWAIFALNLLVWNLGNDLSTMELFEHQACLASISALGLVFSGVWQARGEDQRTLKNQHQILTHQDRQNTMGEMATHIVHELAHPISTTSAYADLAISKVEQGTLDREGVLDILNRSANETKRMGELVKRMQGFARNGELIRETTTAREIIEGIAHMIDLAAKDGEVGVSYDLPDLSLSLQVDILQVQQAILNLARNAIDAMEGRETRQLTITASRGGKDTLWIMVKDTGTGISSRPEAGTSTKPEGMGVGLQVTEAIMEAHDGALQLQGNECRLVFPV